MTQGTKLRSLRQPARLLVVCRHLGQIALVLAAVVGGVRFLVTSRRRLPLGPFLGIGALVGLFYPDQLARLLGSG